MTNLARRNTMPFGDLWDFWPLSRPAFNRLNNSIWDFHKTLDAFDDVRSEFKREDDKLIFEQDLPGVKREELKVSIVDGNVEMRWVRNDREWARNLYHGDIVSAEATLRDGVLRLEMKTTEPESRRVDVEVK